MRQLIALCTCGALLWSATGCPGTGDRSSAGIEVAASSADTTLPHDMVASWGRQAEFFQQGDFSILEWRTAQTLLLQKTYRGGKMYHTGWITIYTRDEDRYLTREPEPDAFLGFMGRQNLPMDGFAPE